MKAKFQISNNLNEVTEMLYDWDTMLIPVFCKKYNYDTDEALDILKNLMSDYMILTQETERENIIGIDNRNEEYAQLYNFL